MRYHFIVLITTLLSLCACGGHHHSYGEWSVAIEGSCTQDEFLHRFCEECHHEEVKIGQKAPGHDFVLDSICLDNAKYEIEKGGFFSCARCQYSTVMSLTSQNAGLPILSFQGSLDGISKENKVNVQVDYDDFNQKFACAATLKIQGATSATFPKKNYTMQLLNNDGSKYKVEMQEGWGKESKYCLKANWIDYSQSRNVVSAKIFGQVVHSRNINDPLQGLINGGAIDGYPVLIYLNNEFHGLYTFNIPKDNWMFDMSSKDTHLHQAILMGDDWTSSVAFQEPISDPNDVSLSGWDLEYCSTEETSEGVSWVADSMNRLINFVLTADDQSFKNQIRSYLDLERTIDVILYTYVICGADNLCKNVLWVTFDGDKWLPSMYDMDSTWGLVWDGLSFYNPHEMTNIKTNQWNKLYYRIVSLFYQDVLTRYRELRSDILSESHLKAEFKAFLNLIPDYAFQAEKEKWGEVPNNNVDHLQQIEQFIDSHLEALDWYLR